MSAATTTGLLSVRDYLAEEMLSPVKREYVGGLIYVRPSERNAHNLIAGNILGALHSLRGSRWQPFNSDTKIRLRLPTQYRFYYPDVQSSADRIHNTTAFRTNRT
jgi:Uma2 family endonuclease